MRLLLILLLLSLGVKTFATNSLSTTLPKTTEEAMAHVTQAQLDHEQMVAGKNKIYVVFDITNNVQQARVYRDGELIKRTVISDQSLHRLEGDDKKGYTCGFPTLGRMVPQKMKREVFTTPGGATQEYFIELDAARGTGSHVINTGYFPTSITYHKDFAKYLWTLFEEKDPSGNIFPELKITSRPIIDVVDRSPGLKQQLMDCVKECKAKGVLCKTPQLSDLVKTVSPSAKRFSDSEPDPSLQLLPPAQ